MKFIKDIIGEKRDQIPMSPADGGQVQGTAAPERDMLTSILAETRANAQATPPLKLEAASRVEEAAEPRKEAVVVASETRVDAPASDAVVTPDGADALTAFLAERNRVLQSVVPAEAAPEPPAEDARDDAIVVDDTDADAAPLADDGGLERPYRIFTRRNRTKMLRLEAAAEAASQSGSDSSLSAEDVTEDVDFADEIDLEQGSYEGTRVDLLDHGPDEFLHIRNAATAAAPPPAELQPFSHTDVPSQPLGTGASAPGEELGDTNGSRPARRAVTPDPVKLVTDPAFTGGAELAADRPVEGQELPVDEQANPAPMRVVEASSASPRPELGAAFPEPAFAETAAAAGVDLGEADLGLPMGRAGRVKTRLLGFDADMGVGDPFAQTDVSDNGGVAQFPVGWLVVVDGPGRGAGFTLFAGVSVIGRGEGQTVRLDFGDSSISRDQHAAIAYDPEQQGFFIGHGGKANLVRRNGRPVLSTEALAPGDVIRVGETTLRFVPLCGPEFSWQDGAHLG